MSSLCNTATTRSDLPDHPHARDPVLAAVPTHHAHLSRYVVSDDPDLHPAVLFDGRGKHKFIASWAIYKRRVADLWPSSSAADASSVVELQWRLLAYQRSLATPGDTSFLTTLVFPRGSEPQMCIYGIRSSGYFFRSRRLCQTQNARRIMQP